MAAVRVIAIGHRSSPRLELLILGMTVTTMTACQPASRPLSSDTAIHVIKVGAAHYAGSAGAAEQSACQTWRLGEPEAERFLRLSKRYENIPYSAFYQTACSISGQLQAEGRLWTFQIDGGGTATWTDGQQTRYWGCSDKQRESLVILATDGMDPK